MVKSTNPVVTSTISTAFSINVGAAVTAGVSSLQIITRLSRGLWAMQWINRFNIHIYQQLKRRCNNYGNVC